MEHTTRLLALAIVSALLFAPAVLSVRSFVPKRREKCSALKDLCQRQGFPGSAGMWGVTTCRLSSLHPRPTPATGLQSPPKAVPREGRMCCWDDVTGGVKLLRTRCTTRKETVADANWGHVGCILKCSLQLQGWRFAPNAG